MNKQRIVASLAFLVIAITNISLPAMAAESKPDGRGPFVDVDGSMFEPDVSALWSAGITSGCDPWEFCPDDPVTRGEMAAFLARALNLDPSTPVFSDTAQSPFAGDIGAIADAGITNGCAADVFCPTQPVTRGQMASFLARALDLPAAPGDPFADDDGTVYEGDIARLAAAGITAGCADGAFCPDAPVTRAQMAAFLTRALHLPIPAELPVIPSSVVDAYVTRLALSEWTQGSGVEVWRPVVEAYFRPSDVDRALRIMSCESQGDPYARNHRSGASGLFQHLPKYWSGRSADAGFSGASIYDPEANVAVAAWLVYHLGGWSHWTCRG
ncbi:MAG: S-layer homology domain-containing protein [Acidimicrobiia bacterium]